MFENYKESLFDDQIILRSQQWFRSDHHNVYTEEVNKVALSTNDDKRVQTYDKIKTYPYGTPVIKVCENEMLLKNKFGDRLNNESPALKKKAQVAKNKSCIIRNELHELINEAHSPRNNSQVVINEAHVIRNNSQVVRNELHELKNEAHVVIKNNFQSLRNKAQALRDKDKTKTKTNTKGKDKDKTEISIRINNKINLINIIYIGLQKAKTEITNKIKLVDKAMYKLKDEIYIDDSRLRLVKLNKIDVILDDAINVVVYEICRKKREIPKMINIDKHKNIDGYVSKLTVIINNKIKLVRTIIMRSIDIIMCDIKNKSNMVNEKIHNASELDTDTLHLKDDNVNEFKTYLMERLKSSRKKIKNDISLPEQLLQGFEENTFYYKI